VGHDGDLLATLQHPNDAPPEAAQPRAAAGYGRVLVRESPPDKDADPSA
jgi:hypothetical protein